jgi:uncharacterized membrane protein YoaK (UPF0700 family)
MFISTAHSFRQQARLAITLAWVAGYTNILSVLTCGHVTSHVSGTASEAGRFFVEGLWGAAGFALFLLTMFLIGAMIAGLATEVGRRRGWESIYVLPMGIEALLLSGFALFVEQHTAGQAAHGARLYAMTGLASMAMGLQNATVTHISGGAVRTTHVTGVLSDLGFELARFLLNIADVRRARLSDAARRLIALVREPEAHRLMLLASIMLSFAGVRAHPRLCDDPRRRVPAADDRRGPVPAHRPHHPREHRARRRPRPARHARGVQTQPRPLASPWRSAGAQPRLVVAAPAGKGPRHRAGCR